MTGEAPFRIALAAMLLAVMPIVVLTRWKASRTGERISWEEEGLFVAVVLRLWGVVMWFAFLLYLVYPAPFSSRRCHCRWRCGGRG